MWDRIDLFKFMNQNSSKFVHTLGAFISIILLFPLSQLSLRPTHGMVEDNMSEGGTIVEFISHTHCLYFSSSSVCELYDLPLLLKTINQSLPLNNEIAGFILYTWKYGMGEYFKFEI